MMKSMRGFCLALLCGAGMLQAMPALADTPVGLTIARANACMGCHAVDRKLVGPSFREIAQRYQHDGHAGAKLAEKVRDGGSGIWGVIPMPAHPAMSEADIRSVVSWVLAGAPDK